MKICAVQTQALKGDIAGNIARHLWFAELAIANGANMIVFPELSVTGYEPTLAASLATTATDERLDCFQELSDKHRVTICIGLPTRSEQQFFISMKLIPTRIYALFTLLSFLSIFPLQAQQQTHGASAGCTTVPGFPARYLAKYAI